MATLAYIACMRIRFATKGLERLATDIKYTHGLGPDIVRAYRKAIGFIEQCSDERDLRAIRGYRLKQLEGNRQDECSLRLNDQWRLILQFVRDSDGKLVLIINVEDYHR